MSQSSATQEHSGVSLCGQDASLKVVTSPLPMNWANFMVLPENKADIARFLSEKLISNTPHHKEITASGGFEDELEVQSSKVTTDVSSPRARHEEADKNSLACYRK